MSDLISRNELIKRFLVSKDGHRIPERDCDNFEVTISVKDVKTIIKEQPTAYDIDKIVEELEIERKTANNTYNSFNMDVDLGRVFGLEKAIEIVKQGCVSDDVCEYFVKCEEIYAGCNKKAAASAFCWFNECGDYKYCPYCGKKIKVVE